VERAAAVALAVQIAAVRLVVEELAVEQLVLLARLVPEVRVLLIRLRHQSQPQRC
jgi:hypothetical protein